MIKTLLFAIIWGIIIALLLMPFTNPSELFWWVIMIILAINGNVLFQILTKK
jgi:uncharacterized protein YhhL (DUF1145 family)